MAQKPLDNITEGSATIVELHARDRPAEFDGHGLSELQARHVVELQGDPSEECHEPS